MPVHITMTLIKRMESVKRSTKCVNYITMCKLNQNKSAFKCLDELINSSLAQLVFKCKTLEHKIWF